MDFRCRPLHASIRVLSLQESASPCPFKSLMEVILIHLLEQESSRALISLAVAETMARMAQQPGF